VFGKGLEALAARGTDILSLYTRYVEETLTKVEHFHEAFRAFDFRGRLEVDVNRNADHTYTELSAQQAVIARIARWVSTRATSTSS
jgi:hypothetical protein